MISEFEKGPLRRLIATKELLVREVLGRINVQDPREGLVHFLCATQGFCGRLRENARRERGARVSEARGIGKVFRLRLILREPAKGFLFCHMVREKDIFVCPEYHKRQSQQRIETR